MNPLAAALAALILSGLVFAAGLLIEWGEPGEEDVDER